MSEGYVAVGPNVERIVEGAEEWEPRFGNAYVAVAVVCVVDRFSVRPKKINQPRTQVAVERKIGGRDSIALAIGCKQDCAVFEIELVWRDYDGAVILDNRYVAYIFE